MSSTITKPRCEWCDVELVNREFGTRYCNAAHRAAHWRAAQRGNWRINQPNPVEPDTSMARDPKPCRCVGDPIRIQDEPGEPERCFRCGSWLERES